MSQFVTVLLWCYCISDGDDNWHHPDNPLDFDEADALLTQLREENPGKEFTLFAEIDA